MCGGCRYPVGGDTMSVTQGVVSRIEVTSYVHGAAELLGIQVDAAINSGNSGGPAFNEHGQCVGIAFQSLRNEDVEVRGRLACCCCCLGGVCVCLSSGLQGKPPSGMRFSLQSTFTC